VPTRARGGS